MWKEERDYLRAACLLRDRVRAREGRREGRVGPFHSPFPKVRLKMLKPGGQRVLGRVSEIFPAAGSRQAQGLIR